MDFQPPQYDNADMNNEEDESEQIDTSSGCADFASTNPQFTNPTPVVKHKLAEPNYYNIAG